jgi:hypothetical protein
MKTLKVVLPFTLLCLLLLTCKERDPVNPLDPDNPNTRGQAYTIQAAATGIGKVKVHWRKVNQPEVKSYRIYRSVAESAPSFLVDVTDTVFSDAGLQPYVACTYFYRLIWEDGRELHQSPTAGVVTFNAPTGLTITNVTRNRVEMQWNGLSWLDNYARCRIYRQSGGAFSLYDSTSSTQYVDTRVDTGITYHYKLMAVATDGSESNYSGEAYATPGNSAPVIDSLKASQPFTGWGEQVTITCYAHDNDGDPISYSWQALDGGTISGFGRIITFQVPQDSLFAHRVMVTVSDNYSIGERDTLGIATLVYTDTWNMAKEYSITDNPNSVWSYGRKWSADGNIFDLMTVRWGTSGWFLGNWGHGGPSIQGDPNVGIDLWAKDNSNGLPAVRWKTPKSGMFNLVATFTGWDSRGVDVIVYIAVNDSIIFSHNIRSYLDSTKYTSNKFHLDQGGYIDFLIQWNAGCTECAWTLVNGIINRFAQ